MSIQEFSITFDIFEQKFAGWNVELIHNRLSEISAGVWVARIIPAQPNSNVFANVTKEWSCYVIHVYRRVSPKKQFEVTEWIELEIEDTAKMDKFLEDHRKHA